MTTEINQLLLPVKIFNECTQMFKIKNCLL